MATCLGGIPLATRLVVGACLVRAVAADCQCSARPVTLSPQVIYAYYPLLYSDDDAFGYSAPLYPPAVFAPFWEGVVAGRRTRRVGAAPARRVRSAQAIVARVRPRRLFPCGHEHVR